MAAVTQRINTYVGGVSKQSDIKKLNGQVIEADNAYPDPTFGLTKRPGLDFKKALGTGTDYADGKWFHILRDDQESYFGVIKNKQIKIWNTKTGNECTVEDRTTTLALNGSDNGGSGVTTIRNVPVTGGSGTGMTVNVTGNGTIATAFTVCAPGKNYEKNDVLTLDKDNWDPEAGSDVKCKITTDPPGEAGTPDHYLSNTATLYPKDFDVMTVQDRTYITNKTRTVETLAAPSYTAKSKATVKLKSVEYSSKYVIKLNGSDYTYTSRNEDYFETGGSSTDIEKLSAEEILNKDNSGTNDGLARQINAVSGFSTTMNGTSFEIEKDDGSAFTISIVKGAASGTALEIFQEQVDNISVLPKMSNHGRIAKIINTGAAADDFYSEFVADNTTYNVDGTVNVAGSGKGFWQETISPSVSAGLKGGTMPHQLVNSDVDRFYFDVIPWTARLTGDDTSNLHPSFVGEKIQQAFFYGNRLGFLTQDNVSMSQASEYDNFYHVSSMTAVPNDPVDISCSSVRPAVLHGVVPVTQGLVLFSRNQQFIMSGIDGIFTPAGTSIKGISSYEMDTNIDPVDVGDRITFISKTESYTRIFNMITRGFDENPTFLDIGKVISEWVPSTVDQLIGNAQNTIIALLSSTSKEVYFYRTFSDGEKDIMQSWFKWILPGNVQFASIIDDKFRVVTHQQSQYTYGEINLNMVPTAATLVSTVGSTSNPCVDLLSVASDVTYSSSTGDSKCYLPYNDVTDLTPIILVASVAGTEFDQAGFSMTPSRGNDGAPYFLVPDKDLSDIKAQVYVGYRYNLDVTLPRIYYKLRGDDKISDFSSTLTIARMKFSLGLSGVAGFKVKKKGFDNPSQEFTADTGTTITLTHNGTEDGPTCTLTKVKTTSAPGSASSNGSDMLVNLTLAGGVVTAMTVHTEGTGYKVGNYIIVDKDLVGTKDHVQGTIATLGTTVFKYNIDLPDVTDAAVKLNGRKTTAFTIAASTQPITVPEKGILTLTDPPGAGVKVLLYADYWYDLQSIKDSDYYLADDVPMSDQSILIVPIHQRNENFTVRVFSDSPFPVALNSMMWEGNYSPRFYRRT